MTIKDTIQKKIKETLKPYSDTILDCSVRVGKTKIALDLIEQDEKVLWVYPRVFMMEGYQEDIKKFPPKSKDITFTTMTSLKKFKDQFFDRIIVDEVQDLSSAQIKILSTIKYKSRLGMSGSLSKRTLDKLSENLNWNVGCKYSLESAIKDGLVKDYNIYIHMVDMNNSLKNTKFKKYGKTICDTEEKAYESLTETIDYFSNQMNVAMYEGRRSDALKNKMGELKYTRLRTELIYNSLTLFEYTVDLIKRLSKNKLLVYTLRTDIADLLGDTSFHTKNRDKEMLEWFKESEQGCLGTVNCISTGITIKNLHNVIFHAFESNPETFLQKLGRSLYYDDNELNSSNVHVCVLKNTQAEKWIEHALSIMNRDSVRYIYKNKSYTYIEWLQFKFPNNAIFKVNDTGAYILYNGKSADEGLDQYFFPTNPTKMYTFKSSRVKPIKL